MSEEDKLTKQHENTECELQNSNRNLDGILKRIDALELSVSESDTWSGTFFSMGFGVAAVGLLLAGAHIWFAASTAAMAFLLGLSSSIARLRIRRRRKSKTNISS